MRGFELQIVVEQLFESDRGVFRLSYHECLQILSRRLSEAAPGRIERARCSKSSASASRIDSRISQRTM
jgi:hypothetical protein